jgi:hypothetical protein
MYEETGSEVLISCLTWLVLFLRLWRLIENEGLDVVRQNRECYSSEAEAVLHLHVLTLTTTAPLDR